MQWKNQKKYFGFWDNRIWISFGKFSLLWREYMSLAVKVLTNSSNILDVTKSKFFQNTLPQINGTVE